MNPDTFTIKYCAEEDLPRMREIYAQLSPEPEFFNFQRFKETFQYSLPYTHILGAFQDNTLIGCGSLVLERRMGRCGANVGRIEEVVVDKKHRNMGAGLKLVEALIELAEAHNCYKVILNCSEENVSFYERCGLKKHGIEMRTDL